MEFRQLDFMPGAAENGKLSVYGCVKLRAISRGR
jgi:hypothetical protein